MWNCGFVDLRREPDGSYRRQVCGKEYGPEFRDMARALLDPKTFSKLDGERRA